MVILSLSPSRRHLFYSHSGYRISRVWLNGENNEDLITDFVSPFNTIVGLEVDLNRNRLYWTKTTETVIRYLELNNLEEALIDVSYSVH